MNKFSNSGLYLKNISIKTIFIISFIVILLSTVTAIGYINYTSWMDSINDLITKTVDGLNEQIVHNIDMVIEQAKHLNVVNKELIEKGIIDINSESGREIPFVNQLGSLDSELVYSFTYGTESGEYYGARKNKKNIVEVVKNNEETGGHTWYYSITKDKRAGRFVLDGGEYDPRTREWYKAAKKTTGIVFSPIYRHLSVNDLALSSSIPIYDKDGKLQGVLGSHMNLSRMNEYLVDIVRTENAHTIIVERESGELVANSLSKANYKITKDGDFERISVNEIGHEAIQQAYNSYISDDVENYQIDYENDQFYIKLIEYYDEGLDWIIILSSAVKLKNKGS